MATFSLLFAFSAEANPSYSHPNWIKVSGNLSFVRNPKVNNIKHPDYWQVQLTVTYKNNSNDKILTRLFKKDILVDFSMSAIDPTAYTLNAKRQKVYRKVTTHVISPKVSSTKVNKVELYPGQSTKLTYILPLKNLMSTLDKMMHIYDVEKLNQNPSKIITFNFSKLRHGFLVKSVPI